MTKAIRDFISLPGFNQLPRDMPITQGSRLAARQLTAGDLREAVDQIAGLKAKIAAMQARIDDLDGALEAARSRELHLIDAIAICAVRANMSAEELSQLGVAQLVKGENGAPDGVAWYTLDDLVVASSFAMRQQATVAKFRQLKEHFVVHQRAVTAILDRLHVLSRKNYLTTVDLAAIGSLRDELSNLIKRKI